MPLHPDSIEAAKLSPDGLLPGVGVMIALNIHDPGQPEHGLHHWTSKIAPDQSDLRRLGSLELTFAYESRLELVTIRVRNTATMPWRDPYTKSFSKTVYIAEAWVGVSSRESTPGIEIAPCGFMRNDEPKHVNVSGLDIYSGLNRVEHNRPVISGEEASKSHFALVGGETITWRFRVLSEKQAANEFGAYYGLEKLYDPTVLAGMREFWKIKPGSVHLPSSNLAHTYLHGGIDWYRQEAYRHVLNNRTDKPSGPFEYGGLAWAEGWCNNHYDILGALAAVYLDTSNPNNANAADIALPLYHWMLDHGFVASMGSPTPGWRHGFCGSMFAFEKTQALLPETIDAGQNMTMGHVHDYLPPQASHQWAAGFIAWTLLIGDQDAKRLVERLVEQLMGTSNRVWWNGHYGLRGAAWYLENLLACYLMLGQFMTSFPERAADKAISFIMHCMSFLPTGQVWMPDPANPSKSGQSSKVAPWMQARFVWNCARWAEALHKRGDTRLDVFHSTWLAMGKAVLDDGIRFFTTSEGKECAGLAYMLNVDQPEVERIEAAPFTASFALPIAYMLKVVEPAYERHFRALQQTMSTGPFVGWLHAGRPGAAPPNETTFASTQFLGSLPKAFGQWAMNLYPEMLT